MKRCPKCGTSFPDEANFCPKDAGRLVPDDGASASAAPSDLVGGRFRLGMAFGGGWTGQVHQAEDTQDGNRPCVLKLVDPAVFPTPLMLQRTERELKQLERLDAPGVARIIAHGRTGDRLWIASEVLEGTALHELVGAQGPQPLERATHIVLAIGRALGESAKAGVIHRDLAPKNVIVDDDGVKLINFGVPVPGDGEIQGVPEFVSPEQVDGKPVDQRSNIYSLAAIYYYLLTGRPPFTGDRQVVLEQHRSGTPEAPSSLAAVPALVEAVVMKALEKSSSKRYMTLRQLLEAIESAAGGADPGGTQPMGRASSSAGGKPTRKKMQQTMLGFGSDGAVDAGDSGEAQATTPMPAQPHHAPADGNGQPAAAPAVAAVPLAPVSTQQPEPVIAAPAAPVVAAPVVAAPVVAAPVVAAPVVAAPAVAAPAAGATAGKGKHKAKPEQPKSKGRFRETMWFKKGELDAQAAEEAVVASKQGAIVSDKADQLPLEDRYEDDGTLNAQDQRSFSLRTGHTQAMPAMRDAVPQRSAGDSVSEEDLIGEMKGGRGLVIVAAIVAVLVIVGVAIFFLTR